MSIEVTARVWQSSRAQGGKLVLLLALTDQADAERILRRWEARR